MDLTACPTAMNFTENQQGNAVLDKLRAQKDSGRFCDVVFHVRDRTYQAHRNVLAACSPYFDSMLKVNKVAKEHMTVNCSNHEIFEILLEYVYTGTVSIDQRSVKDLVSLANQFMMTKLKGYCCEYMERNLGVSNCFLMRDLADKCNLISLVKTIDAFVLANIVQVWDQAEILEFTVSRLEGMLSNKTMPVTEDLKLQMICKWTRHNVKEREKRFCSLLVYLNWSNIQVTMLYSLLRQDPLFAQSEWCMYFMLQAMEDKGLLFNVYSDNLALLRAKLLHPEVVVNNTPSTFQQATASVIQGHPQGHPQGISDPAQLPNVPPQTAYNNQVLTTMETECLNPELKKTESIEDKVRSENVINSSDLVHAEILSESMSNLVTTGIEDSVNLGLNDIGNSSDSDHQEAPDTFVPDANECGICPDELVSVGPNSTETIEEQVTASSEQLSPEASEDNANKKNRRKGTPVKVRIAKSKIKKIEIKLPPKNKIKRRRGRPRKHPLGDKASGQDATEVTKIQNSLKLRVKKPATDIDEYSDDEENYSDPETDSRQRKRKYPEKRSRRRRVELLQCSICPYTTVKGEERMQSHMRKNHSEDTTFECTECDFSCKWNREFNQHLRTHFPGPPYRCDTEGCAYSVDRLNLLMLHRMKHTDERPHECSICNAKFRSRNNLTSHLRCHTGEKPFQCPVCNRCFATKGTLEQHSVIHSDARPYLCDLCGFATKYQSHLISHMRIHKGDVFKCQYPNCKYTTPKRSQLACHMRSHLSIRSHICSVCGRGFVEKSHLVRHERIHLEEKPFKCYLCDYGSTRRDKLKEHNLKYHNNEVGTSPPKTPYKPRKARRQTFDPQLYPGVTQAQAQAQIEQMIQRAEESIPPGSSRRQVQRQVAQPQQVNPTAAGIGVGTDRTLSSQSLAVVVSNISEQAVTGGGLSTTTTTTGLQVPHIPSVMPTPSQPETLSNTRQEGASFNHQSGDHSVAVSGPPIAVAPASGGGSDTLTVIPASSAPATTTTLDSHALGLFIDPRVPSLMTSQPVALIQQSSAAAAGLDAAAIQASSQALSQPQNQGQLQPAAAGQDYSSIHTFMSIF